MFRYLCEQMPKIIVQLQVICIGDFHYTIYDSVCLSSMDDVNQMPVALSNTESPNCLFVGVFVCRNMDITQKYFQIFSPI